MSLIYEGSTLDNERTVESYGIEDLSTIHLVLALKGGKKKKRRKAYSSKKKNRHRHKSVKLMALSFYNLDEDKVVRLRKYCEYSEFCGPGIFMAKRPNRYYCGKCHKTMKIVEDDSK